ncbi:unnamed protein product, partial [Schistosoma curassoni]
YYYYYYIIALINRLHNRQSSNEKSINQYNDNQLSNDKDDHLDVLDNHQQINDQLMTSLKLIKNLPNYEDLYHDHNNDMNDYQEYKQTIQQINSILSNPIINNPNYTEEELNKELEKL